MIRIINSRLSPYAAFGFLILRVGIGASMVIIYGGPKLMAGPNLWVHVGQAMGLFGITFFPVFWGLLAALAEGVGGLFLALGLFTRFAAFFLSFTMMVALIMLLHKGGAPSTYAQPLQLLIVFVSFIFLGGGKYSIDHSLKWA